ncbi:acyl carrier protein [Kitasatospora sp. NPDC094015]|uniref:acyl carrier protein n=1 Tax=Kitasatospora sp. NPDC094015 TaxID=3155205 RepID=UPI0033253E13
MTVQGSIHLEQVEQDIRDWLVERLSSYLSRPESEINTEMPFAEFGMDSVAALSLFGDIEEKFELYLEPAVAYEHPRGRAWAAARARVAGAPGPPPPGPPGPRAPPGPGAVHRTVDGAGPRGIAASGPGRPPGPARPRRPRRAGQSHSSR